MAAKQQKPAIVKIAGEGTIPLIADGQMRRVRCGAKVEVNTAELAYLKAAGVKFTKEK